MRKPIAVLLAAAIAVAAITVVACPALADGTIVVDTEACGSAYVRIDLGHGDYFNVYNEPQGHSCVVAEQHALSWYVASQANAGLWGYPNLSSGIEWGRYTCDDGESGAPTSPGSRCLRYPVQEKADGAPLTSVSYWPHLANGNVSYDVWFNRTKLTPAQTMQNDGAEIMIWLAHPGITEPASRFCWRTEVQGAWYDAMCWRAHGHGKTWNYVAFIAEKQTKTLPPTWLNAFFRSAIAHGRLSPDWWMTAIDFGPEINTGGTGFAVRHYSLTGVS